MRASAYCIPAALLGLSVACGGDPSGATPAATSSDDHSVVVTLRDPATGVPIGHLDRTAQTYVFLDGWTVALGDIDARSEDDLDPMGGPTGGGVTIDRLRSAHVLTTPACDTMRCWVATYGTDGGAIFCSGCCVEDVCREDCMDLRTDAEEAAMRGWMGLDPIPPDHPALW